MLASMEPCDAGEAPGTWHPSVLLGGGSLILSSCKRGVANVCDHRLAIDPPCSVAKPS